MLELGRNSYIHENAYRNTFGGEISVGNYTSIARDVTFLCGRGINHPPAYNRKAVANHAWDSPPTRMILIGSDVWIGTQALIFPVTIGHGAIVGAGAVVLKDVEPYAVVAGNPAKLIRYRFDHWMIERLLALRWWDWTEEKVEEARTLFGDIEAFLEKYADGK